MWRPVGETEMPRGMELDSAMPPQRWQAAEAHLYPLIMMDPALYEVVVTLVGEASGVLRKQCGTVADLMDVDVDAVLAECPSTAVVIASGVDPVTPIDAARAQRWRELTATRSHDAAGAQAAGGDQ